MSFRVRKSQLDDLEDLYDLSKQFGLLNLPADKNRLLSKLERSDSSFKGELSKEEAEYLFILEDCEEKRLIGSSLIMAKHGCHNIPHSAFQVYKRNHYSEDLGIGFIHQVLKLKIDTDGPTEIGGLLVDKAYRSRPEKLGKLISLSRFMYMADHLNRFEDIILCELTPPLTDEGRSEFWESLGRRFTGLPYQEADLFSQTHKEFISALFPQDEIYLCLLDTKARSVLGRVGEQTKPAQYLLESIGFDYIEEVDPFDGGPHFECSTRKVKVIGESKKYILSEFTHPILKDICMVSFQSDQNFYCVTCHADIRDQNIMIPQKFLKLLEAEVGDTVRVAPYFYKK
jgi:arginine N-succinyltransferase